MVLQTPLQLCAINIGVLAGSRQGGRAGVGAYLPQGALRLISTAANSGSTVNAAKQLKRGGRVIKSIIWPTERVRRPASGAPFPNARGGGPDNACRRRLEQRGVYKTWRFENPALFSVHSAVCSGGVRKLVRR